MAIRVSTLFDLKNITDRLAIVVVAAKSISDAYATKPFPPDPNSPQSTVSTVAREIQEAGGQATALPVDTRDFDSVTRMVEETIRVSSLCK